MLLAMLALIGIGHLPPQRGAAAQVGVAFLELGVKEPVTEAAYGQRAADAVGQAAEPAMGNDEGVESDSLQTFASGEDWTIYKKTGCALKYGGLYVNVEADRLVVSVDTDRVPVEDGTTASYRLAFTSNAYHEVKLTEITEFRIYQGIELDESLLSADYPPSLLTSIQEATNAGLVLPNTNKLVTRLPIPNARAAVARLAACLKTL